jgi:hypothetical protein
MSLLSSEAPAVSQALVIRQSYLDILAIGNTPMRPSMHFWPELQFAKIFNM